jgi:hypothetical protein
MNEYCGRIASIHINIKPVKPEQNKIGGENGKV